MQPSSNGKRTPNIPPEFAEAERYELYEAPAYRFEVDRRVFLQSAGAGLLLLVVSCQRAEGQRQEPPSTIEARLRIAEDGMATVLTGKVEEGQGARTELTLAAAEELRVPLSQVRMQMADTDITPNDWITAGSRTTPTTVPAVRQAAAAARELLVAMAAKQWGADAATLAVNGGVVASNGRKLGYADLAKAPAEARNAEVTAKLTPPSEWKLLGTNHGDGVPPNYVRSNGHDIVTGAHKYPSDTFRPGMLYGAVLRAPAFGAKLISVDLAAARAMAGVVAVRDGDFAGFAAPTSFAARKAMEAAAATAKWERTKQPSQNELWDYFRSTAQGGRSEDAQVKAAIAASPHKVTAEFHIPYVQHAPMEPRAALAEWEDGKLTVHTGTSNPSGVRSQLAEAFRIPESKVRVIVPDFGGGFGGKHTGEAALEAARLAKEAGKPVQLRWTRAEEFTWAYSRPAALIETEAGVDADGKLSGWKFWNYNSGGAALRTPYTVNAKQEEFIRTETPVRQGSYRSLASVANCFAREVLMDDLARAAGKDPLAFRLANLEAGRLRAVLEKGAERFGWQRRAAEKKPNRSVGMACGEEKNSVVANFVEVELDQKTGVPRILEVVVAYECGAILNPAGLRQQVEGCLMMALGPALREAIQFENGEIRNGRFLRYQVPRFQDVPKIDVVYLDKPEAEPAGAGETPIIALAPAVANAVAAITGKPVREMPIRAKT